jgi:hypothetical protein
VSGYITFMSRSLEATNSHLIHALDVVADRCRASGDAAYDVWCLEVIREELARRQIAGLVTDDDWKLAGLKTVAYRAECSR